MLKKTIAFFLSVLMTFGSISVVSASANGEIFVFGGSSPDHYRSVTTTSDGNMVAVGTSSSTNGDMQGLNKGDFDAIIVKYDSDGDVLWKKSFGGSDTDEYYSVTSTPDGNLVAVGWSNSTDGDMQRLNKGNYDAIIVKYDLNGKVLWKKSFGGSGADLYNFVTSTPDGNLVAVGWSGSNYGDMQGLSKGGRDAIIVKYDLNNGDVLWKKSFGGNGDDRYHSVTSTPDGNLVAVGYSNSADGDMQELYKGSYDAIIVKYDLNNGDVLRKESFGGSGDDYYNSVTSTPDGNLVVVGESGSTDGDMKGLSKGGRDAIIVKYDLNNGDVLWKESFGGSDTDKYYSVTSTPDGNLVAVGWSKSTDGDMQGLNKGNYDAIIVKYDSDGDVLWKESFGGSGDDYYRSVTSTPDGNLVVAGNSYSTNGDMQGLNKGNTDAIIVKYDPNGNEGPGENDPEEEGENDPEEEGPDAGNPIGSHPISCNADGTCNILSGMNKIHKTKYILAQRTESVDITTLVPSNYDFISTLWK